ncbi:MAG: SUF system Fe-S cluster assembly regulator [Thiobacillaceae bacterium]|jgi:FeS assembly SUF system regulator
MLHLSKLADYATVLMCRMAAQPDIACSAAKLAAALEVPRPTVAKLLKLLARARLLTSVRGGKGGYLLARSPAAISLADVITAIEGPPGLTECITSPGTCSIESSCDMRRNWSAINSVVVGALAGVSLAQIGTAQMPLHKMASR